MVGEYVLLSMRNLPLRLPGSIKLKSLWVGPYQILVPEGANAMKLALPPALVSLDPVFNIALVKRYVGTVIPAPNPVELDAVPEHEVQAILRHRSVGCGCHWCEYLISFVGYDVAHNEWLPAANLANAWELLQAYQVAHSLT